MNNSEQQKAAIGAILIIAILLLVAAPGSGPAGGDGVPTCTANDIAGTVFRDYDYNGQRSSTELGEANLSISAYDSTGTLAANTTTDSEGNFLFSLASGAYRIEVGALPTHLQPGVHGADSLTTVSTTSTGNCSVNIAVSNPAQYCEADPNLVTPVYISGDPLLGGTASTVKSLVSYPYNATGQSADITYVPPQILAVQSQTGTVWGVAYQRSSQKIFTTAMIKRHAGFGPLSTGGLYVTDYSNPSSPVTSPFVDLKSIGINTGNDPRQAGDLPANAEDPSQDVNVFRSISKISVGDIEISEDEKTLWLINLANRTLYSVFIDLPATVPTLSDVTGFPIPNPGCPDGEYRPWAVKIHDGEIYVGITCSAEISRNANELHAFVMKLQGSAFVPVFDFPLDYTKGYGINPALNPVPDPGYLWKPWARRLQDISPTPIPGGSFIEYPQAILSGLEFDYRGNMILGLMDRTGNSFGPFNLLFGPSAGVVISGAPSAGDLLLGCDMGDGTYTLENNGACPLGPSASAGAGNNQGPGGGEFFFRDNHMTVHQEIALGAVTYKSGAEEVVAQVYDTFQFEDNGSATYSLNNGTVQNEYQIYQLDFNNPAGIFGKSIGIGDVEILCDPAPQEIGNLVWFDADADGSQDANEIGISGVTVSLYDQSNALVAQTTTDAKGEYYFDTSDGILPSSSYSIRLDNPADYGTGGPLNGLSLSSANADQDQRDSDGILNASFAVVQITTGVAGFNNHTFDFGFFTTPVCVPSEEICDEVDNDCDGLIDEEAECTQATPSPSPSNSPSPTPTPDCQEISFAAQIKQVDGNSVALYMYAQQMVGEVQKSNNSSSANKKAQKQLAKVNALHIEIWKIANLELPQTTLVCTTASSCPSFNISATVAKTKSKTDTMLKLIKSMKNLAFTKHSKTILKAATKVKNNSAQTLSGFPTQIINCTFQG